MVIPEKMFIIPEIWSTDAYQYIFASNKLLRAFVREAQLIGEMDGDFSCGIARHRQKPLSFCLFIR